MLCIDVDSVFHTCTHFVVGSSFASRHLGANVPIIMNSRTDTPAAKYNLVLVACLEVGRRGRPDMHDETVGLTIAGRGMLNCQLLGEGSPLVLIHGSMVDGSYYSSLARLLSDEYLTCAYDRMGYGKSDEPSDGDYSFETQGEDLAFIAKQLGGEVDIIAHSGGCNVALSAIAAHPRLFRRAILVEPFIVGMFPPEGAWSRAFMKACSEERDGEDYLAISAFSDCFGEPDPRSPEPTPAELTHINRDYLNFIRQELLLLCPFEPHWEELSNSDVTVVIGDRSLGSERGEVATEIARRLGAPVRYAPGAHNAPRDLPVEFSWLARGILSR